MVVAVIYFSDYVRNPILPLAAVSNSLAHQHQIIALTPP